MASEIIVNTIKAPTTGANANKVIIPSGVTLDASAGTLRPSAGAVVQTVHFTTTTPVSSSSTSAVVTNLSGSITPKYSTSHIYVILHQRVFSNPSAGGSAGDWGLERSTDGGSTFSQIYVRGRTGLTDNTGGCDVQASTMYKDTPGITTAVNYRTTIRNNAGTGLMWVNLDNALATMTIMEVAQ